MNAMIYLEVIKSIDCVRTSYLETISKRISKSRTVVGAVNSNSQTC